jgi:hypothetical protein
MKREGSVISTMIGNKENILTNFGNNYLTIEDIFDLEGDELKHFIEKKDTAPEGNLRDFYQTQSNRGLISKIARHGIKIILWEVINGKSFYLPGSTESKIFVGRMNEDVAFKKIKAGLYGNLKLYMTDFKLPQIQMYIGEALKHNTCVYVNRDFYHRMSYLANEKGKIGGKIPMKLKHVLERLYDEFSYVRRDKIKLIMTTFFRRLRIISQMRGDLVMKDNDHFIKFYYPCSARRYSRHSAQIRNRVLKRLKLDKEQKMISQWSRAQTILMS